MRTTKAQSSLHITSICYSRNFKTLVSSADQAGLSLTWWEPPKTGFLVTRLKCDVDVPYLITVRIEVCEYICSIGLILKIIVVYQIENISPFKKDLHLTIFMT